MDLACKAAKLVKIRNVANIQFKRNLEGQPNLLEINPRFPGTMPLTVAAGVNMPQIALSRTLGLDARSPASFEELAMVRTFHETFLAPNAIQDISRVQNAVANS